MTRTQQMVCWAYKEHRRQKTIIKGIIGLCIGWGGAIGTWFGIDWLVAVCGTLVVIAGACVFMKWAWNGMWAMLGDPTCDD